MKFIYTILCLLAAATVAQAQQQSLLNKTWKIKQVNTLFHATATNLYHKDSTNNKTDYSTLEFNFQPTNTYSVRSATTSNQGSYVFNAAGDSVTIDQVPYKLMGINADTFVTRSYALQVANEAGDMDTAYIFMKMYSLAALPVNWLSFTGQYLNRQVALHWSTAQEQNNEGFEIQHSTTGADFETIGKIAGKGNTTTVSQYSFKTGHYQAGNNYYRLKQIDLDGRLEYSRVVTIAVADANTSITLAPNPATGKVTLRFGHPHSKPVTVVITDASGRQAKQQVIQPGNTTSTIYLNSLNKGIYSLTVKDQQGARLYQEKLIVQ
ncbi:T9SS type A sorting domain-containing protein [Paraflavitalea pollutisoli]|uniref:T9SS type A sorting domain-containing protein n=1 Tax=Paraflavitalea pollutisoli TaxID=3034143 RepID=UPI0023EB1151|nr:T9SS type A sorting domain-containing protein [Paraflavitalea sp. H1-2-19X]